MKSTTKKISPFLNGLITGIILQLAIGPVFFFIINLTLQKSFFDGLAGVFAVTLVDYFYISLAIFGIGKLLKKKKFNKIFVIISSVVLILFGIILIREVLVQNASNLINSNSLNIFSSFISVFILTISSPMTIVFFTSLFATKAAEYNYKKKELIKFGIGTGFATFLFMGFSVILFSLIRGAIPLFVIGALNLLVGLLLIIYGATRFIKILKEKNQNEV